SPGCSWTREPSGWSSVMNRVVWSSRLDSSTMSSSVAAEGGKGGIQGGGVGRYVNDALLETHNMQTSCACVLMEGEDMMMRRGELTDTDQLKFGTVDPD